VGVRTGNLEFVKVLEGGGDVGGVEAASVLGEDACQSKFAPREAGERCSLHLTSYAQGGR